MHIYDYNTHEVATSPPLHQYACLRCRRRKVRCDKILTGCAHCLRHGHECVFSARRPRAPRKSYPESSSIMPTPQQQLMKGNEPPRPDHCIRDNDWSISQYETVVHKPEMSRDPMHDGEQNRSEDAEKEEDEEEDDDDHIVSWCLQNQPFQGSRTATATDQGRVTIGADGKTHYMNREQAEQVSNFETIFTRERVQPLQDPRNQMRMPVNRCEHLDANSLLTTQRTHTSLRSLYPPAGAVSKIWYQYTQHIDIMCKVIYKPDVSCLILKVSEGFQLSPAAETLLFAICYAVVASSTDEDCSDMYGSGRKQLLRKYRIALEQALAQAGWISTQDIVVLQSLALYLTFASEKSRSTWVLSGMIMSLAQAMGLHTDVTSSDLSVAEAEVRRRVWWSLCQVDVRVSTGCGLEPHVPNIMDTQLPLHVNDADLESDQHARQLSSRDERTEMTVSLVKIEHAHAVLNFKRAQYTPCTSTSASRDGLINKYLQRLSEVYLKYFEDSSVFSRICTLGIRFVIARLRKLIHDASKLQEPADPEKLDEPLLLYNVDLLEIARQLPEKSRQFGWFLRCKCSQWHALVYLLLHLCRHTQGAAVERAWEATNSFFENLEQKYDFAASSFFRGTVVGKKNALWEPLLRLLAKARNSRAQSLRSLQGTSTTLLTVPHGNADATVSHEPMIDMQCQAHEGMIADPFLGQSFDFREEMNWEQIDAWAHDFEAGLSYSDA